MNHAVGPDGMHAAPLPWLVVGYWTTVAAMPMHAPSSAHQAHIMARDGMAWRAPPAERLQKGGRGRGAGSAAGAAFQSDES